MLFASKLNLCNIFWPLFTKTSPLSDKISHLFETLHWFCIYLLHLICHMKSRLLDFHRAAHVLIGSAD